MQLTRLEIKGFKSFADKVTINFDEGITGIVGPNGCGKSNVVDSIRWVLGEQKTRVLRSDKMENVIFNGTKKRKPTQLAEVSLTFNNTKNLIPTEYTHVTVTRRYFRSGESEYLLNNVTCRLKDITNLFLDTGIASNTYAIIELRMVDDLLNDKDNSRRSLFEEAAGISKFKIRKKETLKKLGDTDDDLDRVEDLLFEIDKNLKSLERQAKQTKKYYEIKEDYKNFSVGLAKKSIAHQTEVFNKVEKQITAETDKKSSLNTQLSEKEALIEKTKADLIIKEKLLSSRQKSLNQHVGNIRQYESDKKIKNERQRYLNDRIENLKEQISQDKQSNERAAFSIQSLDKERETAESILSDLNRRLEQLRDDFEAQKIKTANTQKFLDENSQQHSGKREQVYQLSKDIEVREIQLSTYKIEMEASQQDSSNQSESLKSFDDKLEEIGVNRDAKNNQLTKQKKTEEDLKSSIDSVEQKISLLKEELTKTNRALDSKDNEYNLTKSLVDNLEGFPEAIKFLKKNAQWKNAPLLSDIISCPEEYRISIENYLETYMNYYVVDTIEDALKAVNLLSDAGRGKANFFILDKLESFKTAAAFLVPRTVPATEIVEYEDKFKKLISFLLENVCIYDGAIPETNTHAILVDKGGKTSIRKFSISGGSVGLFEGKRIGRAKNLEKLAKEIKELRTKQAIADESITQQQSELARLKSSTKHEDLEILTEEINRINESYVTIKTKQEQFGQLLSSSKNKREEILSRIGTLEFDLSDLRPQQKIASEL
ncbi:MAG: chromosome segregation protein, partial [Cyclobacteriaceae bacterium]